MSRLVREAKTGWAQAAAPWHVAVWAAAMIVCGCGRAAGPARYALEGSVTYQGQPVPAGRVVFEPDASAGNSGPAAYAEIRAGRYATPRGQGTVGGPHVVRITGMDGRASPESPQGLPLFSEYQTKADLPRRPGTWDFAVPAEHR